MRFISKIIKVALFLTLLVAGFIQIYKYCNRECNKFKLLCDIYMQWIKNKQDGKEIATSLINKGYQRVAIYGMNKDGDILISDLRNSDVDIVCGIDRRAAKLSSDIPLFTPDDEIPEVDVIIVTAVAFYDEIKEAMEKKVKCPIISIEDAVYRA